jgi:excisionase family DNA binding protein
MRPVIVVAGDAERITAALEATFVTLSPFHNPHIDRRVAKLLGVAKVTILCRAKRGKIPSFRIGTMVRFDPQVISRWLFEQGIQSLSSQKTAGKFLIARIAEISGK